MATLDMDAMRQAIASVDTSALTDSTLDDSQEFLFFYGVEADSSSWWISVRPPNRVVFHGHLRPTARRMIAAIGAVLDAVATPSEE